MEGKLYKLLMFLGFGIIISGLLVHLIIIYNIFLYNSILIYEPNIIILLIEFFWVLFGFFSSLYLFFKMVGDIP